MTLKQIEWLGSLTGLAGAILLAINNDFSGYGFVMFLLSNCFWITFALKTKSYGLLTMQLGFFATSVLGISRWLM